MVEVKSKVYLKRNIHAEMVMEWWKTSGELSMQLTENYLKGELDGDVIVAFISILRRIFIEIYPKVKEQMPEVENYKKYILSPEQIINKPNVIFELEMLIREALEKIGYTQIEKLEPIE